MHEKNAKHINLGEITLIPLSQGLFAVIDTEDFEKVKAYSWAVSPQGIGKIKKFYAASNVMGGPCGQVSTSRSMARVIMDANGTANTVDHINGMTLDNRKANLRICTPAENCQNSGWRDTDGRTSIYKGVCWKEQTKRWIAQCMAGRVQHIMGCWHTPEAAALAYNIAAKKYHGEFAYQNALPDTEEAIIKLETLAAATNAAPNGRTNHYYRVEKYLKA